MVTMYSMIIYRCIAWTSRLLHATAVRLPCVLNTLGILKTEAANGQLDCKWTTHTRSGTYIVHGEQGSYILLLLYVNMYSYH